MSLVLPVFAWLTRAAGIADLALSSEGGALGVQRISRSAGVLLRLATCKSAASPMIVDNCCRAYSPMAGRSS